MDFFLSCKLSSLFMLLLLVVVVVDWRVVCAEEYCASEIFEPACPKNEIINVKSAIYGRREYGRCLKKEGEVDVDLLKKPGYINCSTDVRHIIEPQCAGQQRCEVSVVKIKSNSSCLSFVLKHLEVSYKCIRGRCIACEFEMVNLY